MDGHGLVTPGGGDMASGNLPEPDGAKLTRFRLPSDGCCKMVTATAPTLTAGGERPHGAAAPSTGWRS
jgi:hypothetical protein